jgi:hypothetical protein
MLTSKKTAAGTIRDKNQDFVLIDVSAGFAMVVDGTGPNGSGAARLLAQRILESLRANSHVFSGSEASDRLGRTICEEGESISALYPFSIAGFAAIWIHRGQVALAQSGKSSIISNLKPAFKKGKETPGISTASLPATAEAKFILSSEGLNFAYKNDYLKNIIETVLADFKPEQIQFFWNEAEKIYDGDDRSMVTIQIQSADLDLGVPHEIELFTDVDRQFAIPLWLPASFLGGFGLFALYMAKKVFGIIKAFKSQT